MDRRAHYRTDATKCGDIEVSVLTPGGSSFQGRLIDLSVDGVGMCLLARPSESPVTPILALGEEVELMLTSVLLATPLTASAKVIYRTDEAQARHYGFQFTDRLQMENQLSPASPALHKLFNRRSACRVKPPPGVLVKVKLGIAPGPTLVEAQLKDISASGIGVHVPAEADVALSGAEHIEVSIVLPDCPQPLVLPAILRNRRLDGPQVHYGIEFDYERGGDAQRQQDAIFAFAMELQRVTLQAGKDDSWRARNGSRGEGTDKGITH